MSLNTAQALSLATTLSILEDRCDQIERLIVGGERDRVVHRTVPDIPADVQPALRDHLAALRLEIARLAAQFQLNAGPRSARQTLAALLATSWQDLEDERPAKLGRYGPVDPAVIPSLDPSIVQLIARVRAMQALLNASTDGGRPADKAGTDVR